MRNPVSIRSVERTTVSDALAPPRIGVLGTSPAARRVWQQAQRAGMTVVAVGGCNATEAVAFIHACGGDVVYQEQHQGGVGPQAVNTARACTYDELVKDSNVDVVYMTLPVAKRDTWVSRCIQRRKHILLSVPAAPSAALLQKWIERATPLQLLLTDDAALMYGTRMQRVEQMFRSVGENTIGELRNLRVCCSSGSGGATAGAFTTTCNDTDSKNGENKNSTDPGLGVLGDLGWLAVAAVLHLMQYAMPKAVLGRAVQRRGGGSDSITEFSGELIFAPVTGQSVVTATLYVNHHLAAAPVVAEQSLIAYGTTGSVVLHDLIVPAPDVDGSVAVTVASHASVQGAQLRRNLRRETELRITESVPWAELPWHNLRGALVPDLNGTAHGFASRFRGNTEEATAYLRRTYVTQTVIDALREAAGMTLTAQQAEGSVSV
ncbi:oxidoreductase [Trypanosoma grayi]|uniref:oxidoreductase n=1 Tax=Trypanosoma grayi TaxID=71804 RepID=UPI0004F430BF|nr:oxidoreductase [Trypanosoma grayi]KEG09016.1 oxidoreductase [Trypanosoma grayi]